MAREPGAKGKAARRKGGSRAKLTSKAAAPNLFLYGVGGLLLSLAIVFMPAEWRPAEADLRTTQAAVLACLVGISGAAITTGLSGILEIKTKVLVASGPFAIFVLCFWVVMGTGAPGVLPKIPFSSGTAP